VVNIVIDRPLGILAQRFYNFNSSIILASGIGVTPIQRYSCRPSAREKHRDGDLVDWLTDLLIGLSQRKLHFKINALILLNTGESASTKP
jgi:hypothetical protein